MLYANGNIKSQISVNLIKHLVRITYTVADIVSLQNENVNREATSVSLLQDVRRPNCRTGHRNLCPKTFQFRESVWSSFSS